MEREEEDVLASVPFAEPEDDPRAPQVFDDEDGDLWWIAGHVTDTEARLALLVSVLGPESFYDRHEAYETARTAKVTQGYWKPDPTDPEEGRFIRAEAGEPEAGAFTLIEAE